VTGDTLPQKTLNYKPRGRRRRRDGLMRNNFNVGGTGQQCLTREDDYDEDRIII
jgi:hypothetical protein